MVITCEELWREVSNYLDGEVDPALRLAIEDHVRGCQHCAAILDGTRNVIQLYGDERMLEVPLGFSQRLHQRMDENMPANMSTNVLASRRTFLGWMVATAAAALVVGSLELVRATTRSPEQRAEMARRGAGVPPDMMVVVAEDGKLFHLAGCSFIHERNKLRTVTATEASREGYTPCVRCLGKYLAKSEES
jgi:anti-sigma factor RsiW